jgi:CBS domain-containing protein
MRVQHWMTEDVRTIDADAPAENAWKIIMSEQIRQLPVMSDGELVGVISRGDLLRNFENIQDEEAVNTTEVREAMSPEPLTVSPDMPFEEATNEMYRSRVGSLPVLDDDGELVGILTRSDLFTAIMEITGMKDSVRREEFEDTHLGKAFSKLRERPEGMFAKSFLAYRDEDAEKWICLVRFAERSDV